ncbi:Enkurin domain-containing protein [Podarcis lilfordi]|uniref:Enkurin domain-containing protein n=1 Tax=Podarcis lilfordi TaxID=74358 RepID=A0AA35L567_9SAUR|nr:Enkurin domain-containing protein [Podarcis lilfordi]
MEKWVGRGMEWSVLGKDAKWEDPSLFKSAQKRSLQDFCLKPEDDCLLCRGDYLQPDSQRGGKTCQDGQVYVDLQANCETRNPREEDGALQNHGDPQALHPHSKRVSSEACQRTQALKAKKEPRHQEAARAECAREERPPHHGHPKQEGLHLLKRCRGHHGRGQKPLRACVDVRKGDKFLLDDSGLIQRYLHKKDFGVTPKYIKKRIMDAKKAQEESDAYLQQALLQKGLTRLSKAEKEKIMEGLKKNWEEINHEYQSLSVFLDSIPRRLRKEKMEVEMMQLEHYIKLLEKHDIVYISSV